MRTRYTQQSDSRITHHNSDLPARKTFLVIRLYVLRCLMASVRPWAARPGVVLVRVGHLVELAPAALAPSVALSIHVDCIRPAHDVQRLGRAIVAGLHSHQHTA